MSVHDLNKHHRIFEEKNKNESKNNMRNCVIFSRKNMLFFKKKKGNKKSTNDKNKNKIKNKTQAQTSNSHTK